MRMYLRYVPLTVNFTGAEYIQQYIDEHYKPTVTWESIISDGVHHYGYLSSSDGDMLAKALQAVEGRYSASRLTEQEFIGACYLLYNPAPARDEDPIRPIPTPLEFLQNVIGRAIGETEAITAAKYFKRFLFKEVVRKLFPDYNDLIADITKSVVLLLGYSNELTSEEQATVDSLMTTLKQVYTKEMCLDALQSLTTKLQGILASYYQDVERLQTATTKEEIDAIKLSLVSSYAE